jgi:hypothetical protein
LEYAGERKTGWQRRRSGEIGPEEVQAEDDDLADRLSRLPDLTNQLREAPRELKRQVLEAFDLQITYDKAERRIEILATVSEAVADAFEDKKALASEGLSVTARDIAGARCVSRGDARAEARRPFRSAPGVR